MCPEGRPVAVAMSGGVDSSVAAALLVDRGFRVIGLTMHVLPPGDGVPGIAADARAVANSLGIPHHTVDLTDSFRRHVMDYFVSEYRRGRTPNPCIACNRHIKMGALLDRALELGAEALATGHYARVAPDPLTGRHELRRAVDRAKDQSYVLYSLEDRQLSSLLLPLGDMTKDEVRRAAQGLGLRVAGRAESQEICFIRGDYREFLASTDQPAPAPGPIVDLGGRVLGQHGGLHGYTVGQRRGLGLAGKEPLYVLELDPGRNAVIVGSLSEAESTGLEATGVNWLTRPPGEAVRAGVKVRYRSPLHPATVTPGPENRVTVQFDEPVTAVAPGQAAVFYRGDVVLGGGVIDRALPPRTRSRPDRPHAGSW